jgi:rubrerythrin
VVGTPPPPASLKGAVREAVRQLGGRETTLLLDKLGERLAFERTGTRLYETLLEKVADGGFDGGPSRSDLERIRDEEAAHFRMLHEKVVELDGDPTAVTPSADVAGVASTGVVAVVSDARTSLAESLEAILVAELADRDGWERLVALAEQAGQDDLAQAGREAERTEQEHLTKVRGWLSAYARSAAGGGPD